MMNFNAQLPYEKSRMKVVRHLTYTTKSRAHHPASHMSVCH